MNIQNPYLEINFEQKTSVIFRNFLGSAKYMEEIYF